MYQERSEDCHIEPFLNHFGFLPSRKGISNCRSAFQWRIYRTFLSPYNHFLGQFVGPRNFRGSGSIFRAAEFPWLGVNFQGRGISVARGQFSKPRNFRGSGSIFRAAEFPWLGVSFQGRGISVARSQFSKPRNFRCSRSIFGAAEFPWLGVNFQSRGISVTRGQFSRPRNFRGAGSTFRAAENQWLGVTWGPRRGLSEKSSHVLRSWEYYDCI